MAWLSRLSSGVSGLFSSREGDALVVRGRRLIVNRAPDVTRLSCTRPGFAERSTLPCYFSEPLRLRGNGGSGPEPLAPDVFARLLSRRRGQRCCCQCPPSGPQACHRFPHSRLTGFSADPAGRLAARGLPAPDHVAARPGTDGWRAATVMSGRYWLRRRKEESRCSRRVEKTSGEDTQRVDIDHARLAATDPRTKNRPAVAVP